MGLGKTVQTATAISILMRRPEINRVLVVAPSSLRLNWQQELDRWAPELATRRVIGKEEDRMATYLLPIPVLVASYEQIRNDAPKMTSAFHFDLVVLDEAQRIKNLGSSVSLACKLLSRKFAWALTGTPIENSVDDMRALYSFLKPGLVRPYMPKAHMHSAIRPYFLRRRKAQVLGEMPEIFFQDIPLELEGEQLAAYEEAWDARLATANSGPDSVDLLALLTKLKQICNFDPVSEQSVKAEVLMDIVEDIVTSKSKCLIFSQYVETLDFLSQRIGIEHEVFHGGLREDERAEIVARFEESPGPQFLLISLKAGGVGLNLNSASYVVLFDRWWNPAVENQAITRAHRFGKKEPLQVIRFIVKDTIEERIDSILTEKQDLFHEYVDGAENWKSAGLTKSELHRILQVPWK